YFRLQIKDNDGAIGIDTIKITVFPKPNDLPIANAGEDIQVQLPNPVIRLNGLGSSDPDGTIEHYSWAKVSGPAGLTITNSTTARPGIVGVVAGEYVFRLTVTDNDSARSSDEVTVKVLPETLAMLPNESPVSNAGENQTLTYPAVGVVLNGSGSK